MYCYNGFYKQKMQRHNTSLFISQNEDEFYTEYDRNETGK